MYKLLYSLAAVALLAGCGSSKKSTSRTTTQNSNGMAHTTSGGTGLSKEDQDAGYVALFNGNSLAGWHSYGMSAPGQAWKVDNGTIHLDAASKQSYQTNGGGDLVTDNEYENY